MIQEEKDRIKRLNKMKQDGVNPYPARVNKTHTVKEYIARFDEFFENKKTVTLTGRAKTIRKHGGLTFVSIQENSSVFQLVLRRDHMGEDLYHYFNDISDNGDFVEATGLAFVTKKGQNSLDVKEIRVITKTILPLPEKWHGLNDIEVRYRKRYLDLIANDNVKDIFIKRALIIKTIRDYLDEFGFLEVETPILQPIPGGASAKPFLTHHNALDEDMYLRIAPELYLKRCVVGGFDRVYEVARCFRNEGIDHSHNPEFTQIEGYVAYMDYKELMDFLETMIIKVIDKIGLDHQSIKFQGNILNFSAPWTRKTFRELMIEYGDFDIEEFETRDDLAQIAIKNNVPVDKTDSKMTIIDNLYKHLARPKIIQPTYITDYPVEMTPLAKRKEDDPRYAEMFQLVYGGGVENIKAFSELNDPLDQEARFREQEEAREAGDDEAQFFDADYVESLKHGMPPTAGFGIGIDRLTATLVDSHNLKEVILFPTLRHGTDK